MKDFEQIKIRQIINTDEGADIVFVNKEETYFFLIAVGIMEAFSISLILKKENFERPLTHDLFYSSLKGLNAKVESVVITELKDKTYYAKMRIIKNVKEEEKMQILLIDCRPSDGIALALRFNAPIFAASNLLKKVINPNQDNF